MINREEALKLVEQRIASVNMRKHCYAVEAVMRALAGRLGQDENLWGLTGLLHDLDAEETAGDLARHTFITVEWLKDSLPPESLHAIAAHCHHKPAESSFDKAILCADPVTGLVTAAALMHPTRLLSNVSVEFLKKRFREKRFAAGANREQIAGCENLGLSLDEFLEVSLKAMQGISKDLGL